MGVKESNLLKEIQLKWAAMKIGVLFRNQTGSGYQGQVLKTRPGKYIFEFQKGDIIIRNPRYISFGLVKGGGDLIGWKNLLITAEMVGKTIAQFASREGKTENADIKEEQKIFHTNLNKAGGDSKIVYTVEEAD